MSPVRTPVILLVACVCALPIASAAGESSCPPGMRLFTGGSYRLGDGSATVSASSFCLDENEVTAAAYEACVRSGGCRGGEELRCSRAATYGDPERATQPINCVSWLEADAYCRRERRRLPTEAEWEWAARGAARGTPYPWGNEAPGTRACWDGKGNELGRGGRKEPCAVGAHPEGNSPDGIADLAGNVREWTASSEGRFRIVRGGSWGDSLPEFLAVAFRGMNAPDERFELTGFRCAADPASSAPLTVSRAAPAVARPPAPAAHRPPANVPVLQADELRIIFPARR